MLAATASHPVPRLFTKFLTVAFIASVIFASAQPVFVSADIGLMKAGTAFTGSVTYTGATSYSITSGQLPVGLTLNTSTGQITGIPEVANEYIFEITASDGTSTDSRRFLRVVAPSFRTDLYVWGDNFSGQIGDGTNTDRLLPTRVGDDTRSWAFIATGYDHAAAITENGELFTWGGNFNGQIGNGTQASRDLNGNLVNSPNSPVRICLGGNCSTDPKWAYVMAAVGYTMAITTEGRMYAWGANASGQLGIGSTTRATTPVEVPRPSGDSWMYVAGGQEHTLAITSAGKLYAWGEAVDGKIGDGQSSTNRTSPVLVGAALNKNWKYVGCGNTHSMAITSEGELYVWGNGGQNQTGLNGTTDYDTPQRLGTDSDWVEVSGGYAHSMGLKSNGEIWGWGANYNGQLGDGTTSPSLTPKRVANLPNVTWLKLWRGAYADHSVFITTNNNLYGVGSNGDGTLGDGTRTDRTTFKSIGNTFRWYRMSANYANTAALGSEVLTLDKYTLNLEVGGTTGQVVATVASIVADPRVTWTSSDPTIASVTYDPTDAETSRTVTVTPVSGGVVTLTATVPGGYSATVQVTVGGIPSWTAAAADTDIGCIQAGVAFSGTIKAGGFPVPTYAVTAGNLPTGLTLNGTTGVISGTVTTPGSFDFTITATNSFGTGVFQFTGGVFGWTGEDVGIITMRTAFAGSVTAAGTGVVYSVTAGALPPGITINASTGAITGTATESGTYRFTLGATACGVTLTKKFVRIVYPNFSLDLYTWGSNRSGELGYGTPSLTPTIYPGQVKTPVGERWVMTAHGGDHSLAVTEDGKLFSWGSNSSGQLGISTISVGGTSPTPTQVCIGACSTPQPKWIWISAGESFSLGITLDGKIYTWGDDTSGALGDGGTVSNKSVPTLIPPPTGDLWINAACGYDNVVAITLEGKLYSWGNNKFGKVGDGTITVTGSNNDKLAPVQIATSLNKVWQLAAAGDAHAMALTMDGDLYSWGSGGNGRLGIGSTTDKSTPTFVASGYKDIGCGYGHSIAIKTDGTLVGWGANFRGQVGDGTTTSRTTAVPVGTTLNKIWRNLFMGQYADHSLGVTIEGELYGWGSNGSGTVGDSTQVDRTEPVRVAPSIWWYRTANHSSISSGLGIEVIYLDKYLFTLTVGGPTDTRVATVSTALPDRTVIWTSSDESIATVDEDGIVTPVSGGVAIITATVMGKYSRSAEVNVIATPDWAGTGSDTDIGCLQIGTAVTESIKAAGYPDPTYAVTAGTLPAGLSFNGTTGALTGTPTGTGAYDFTVTATNTAGTQTKQFTGFITGWVSENVGLIKQGQPFIGSVVAAGSGLTYSIVSGALPAGITLNASTGALTGTPTAPGTYRFTIGTQACSGTITKKFVRTVYPNFPLDLYTWGSNNSGQLGYGNTSTTPTIYPNQVKNPQGERWVMTAHGDDHSMALTEDGKLFVWGSNASGQLGLSSVAVGGNTGTPTRLCISGCGASEPVWVWISAGDAFSLGITLDGKLYTWGSDFGGALGDGGTVSNKSVPTLIPAPSGDLWINAACGYDNVVAVTLEGKLYSWGNNLNGKIGDGTVSTTGAGGVNNNRLSPVQIAASLNKEWQLAAAGDAHAMALTSTGDIYAWGNGGDGRLGINSTTDQSTPTFVGSGYKDISCGYGHSLAIKNDGTLAGWGANFNGQVGDGTTTSRSTPVAVGAALNKTFRNLFMGQYADHSLAVTNDGELFGWGSNGSGTVGDSTKTSRNAPVRVAPSIWWYRTANHSSISSGLGIEVITLDKYYFTQIVGLGTETRIATVSNSLPDRTVVWTSSDPSVATVDQNGKVTPVSGGTAIITATVMGKYSASAKVVVNEVPVATDDAVTSLQDEVVTGNVITDATADSDPDGDIIKVTTFKANGFTVNAGQNLTITGVGVITIAEDGAYTFTPAASYSGPVPAIEYTISDGRGGTDTANLNITVQRFFTGVDANAAFIGETITGTVASNDVVTVGSTYGTPVPDGQNPTGAVLNLNSDGTYDFKATQTGTYTYDVPVCPSGQTSNCPTEKLVITVNDPSLTNNPPVIFPDLATTLGVTPVVIKSLVNDQAGNKGGSLVPSTVTIVSGPANGTATVNTTTGDITYTPAAGVTGTQTIVYRVCDNSTPQICNTGTQEITVLPAGTENTTLASDEFRFTIGSLPVSGNVLDNDRDPENNTRTVTAQTVTTDAGIFTLSAAGAYTFTAKSSFSGTASFPYTACDNGTPQACANATVTILVRLASIEANDDDFSATQINGFTGGTAGNVFTNDKVNNEVLQSSLVTLTLKNNGGVTGLAINATSGNLTIPPSTKAGTYTITYGICQVANPDICDDGTATVVVIPPVIEAVDDNFTSQVISNELGGKVGSIYGNDKISGVNIDQSLRPNLTATITGDGGLTGVTIDENGDITVPANFEPGTYTLTVKICEDLNPENCAESTVTIKIEYTQLVAAGAVTPNSDGKNDFFHIRGLSAFPNHSLVIYNRWGNVVLKAAPYANDWDGRSTNGLTFSGSDKVPAGTYFYTLDTGDGKKIAGSFYLAY